MTSRLRAIPRRPSGHLGVTPGQDAFYCLSLLLDCRELLRKVLDTAAEEAGLRDRVVEKALSMFFIQPGSTIDATPRPHRLVRACTMTFLSRRARSVTLGSS